MLILGLDPGLGTTGWGLIRAEGNRLSHIANGQFKTNANNEIVTLTGQRVLGYSVNADFEIQPTGLVPLQIPLGAAATARSP